MRVPETGEYVRNVGILVDVEIVTPPPPPSYAVYIFDENEAVVQLRLNGVSLKEMTTYNDFYGQGSAVKEAAKEATAYATENGIDQSSEIEVVVLSRIKRSRLLQTKDRNIYDQEFYSFRHEDFSYSKELSSRIVWSSKRVNE